MKQVILAFFTSIIFLFATQNATAGIISHDTWIPDEFSGTNFNLDKDNVNDIRLIHWSDQLMGIDGYLGKLYIDDSVHDGLQIFNEFIQPTNNTIVVDNSFTMTELVDGFSVDMVVGFNYIGVLDVSSCNSCYGLIEINFDGQDAYLTNFVLGDPNGVELNVSVPVPEPGSIVLLGFALIGLAYTKKKRA